MTALRVLVPYDDSANARRALAGLIALAKRGVAVEIHLVNVQPLLRSNVASFVGNEAVADYHHDEGVKALASARDMLGEAGLRGTEHIGVGSPPADTIVEFAGTLNAELIVMGTHGRSAVAELVMGSVATGVLRGVSVPVMLVR